jgi:hypothetical protein
MENKEAMALVEKYQNDKNDLRGFNLSEYEAIECAKVANNHAIEFTEWVRGNYLDIFPFWLEEKSNRKYTTYQLLEIYNKK